MCLKQGLFIAPFCTVVMVGCPIGFVGWGFDCSCYRLVAEEYAEF